MEVASARIPVSTYRLQFNSRFTFIDAQEIIEYLYDLGITEMYSSPYLAAKAGSVHGYDVVDHTRLNPEVGTEKDLENLCRELTAHGMGQILDFVPNHMCIEGKDNHWWSDVLENGRSSRYADFFDINWHPVKKELRNRVLLPFLGDQYGTVLENGELQLRFQSGAFSVQYYEAEFPVEPKSYNLILQHRLDEIMGVLPPDSPHIMELLSIITGLNHLPPVTVTDSEKRSERYREKEILKKRLSQLMLDSSEISEFLSLNVAIFNGRGGEPHTFDLLDELLSNQVYRLSFWRVATEEINYRRFFDINSLSAIRMESEVVFEESHCLLFRLIREGKVTGVRIDHVDGLYDPLSYLQRLQACCKREAVRASTDAPCNGGEEAGDHDILAKPFYIIGEKILLKGEKLPEEWPIYSTTGYDFISCINGLFVDTANTRDFERLYARFVKGLPAFADIVYEKKKLVMQVTLSGEINTLGHYLNNISELSRQTRDFTLQSLIRAITEVIAFFPVYRTYTNSHSVSDDDARYIETAIEKAKRKNPVLSSSVFDFLRNVLLLRVLDPSDEHLRQVWLDFVMKFQQITGPVMAKGLEDTAFYVYNRLISLNDVGESPDRFGITVDAFHSFNRERLRSHPAGMNASATHDTKRGEDVRARINVLSEMPEKWGKALANWSRINKAKKILLYGQPVPDRNEEYLLYQTLLGAWPVDGSKEVFQQFIIRIKEYMVKAIREAKINTSWINPNPVYEEAVLDFVDTILSEKALQFHEEFLSFQKMISHFGAFNSLSQALLKITSPGFPDFYQGTELWDFSLVDPDNRRSIDFELRKTALASLKRMEDEVGSEMVVRELTTRKADGRIKLYIIYKSLNFRRDNRTLFERGKYLPLEVEGAHAGNLCAFCRRTYEQSAIVAIPRFVASLISELDAAPWNEEVWGDTFITVPEELGGTRFRNVFTGVVVRTAVKRNGEAGLFAAEVFAGTPVALLELVGE